MKPFKIAVALALFTALAAPTIHAAPKPTPLPKIPAIKRQANYVKGRCVNMAGKPIAHVKIFIKGLTLAGGQNTETFATTKGDGTFSQRVPAGLYSVYADYTVDRYDERYTFRLEAYDGESDTQESPKGVVENFVWKIKGLRRGEKAKADSEREWNYAYYGARVYPDTRRSLGEYTNLEDATSLSRNYPADSKLVITLTPASALVNNSKGSTITETLRLGDDGKWIFGVRNIPVGIYTATAKVIPPGGAAVAVRCKTDKEFTNIDEVPWAASARIVFPDAYNEYGQTAKLYLATP